MHAVIVLASPAPAKPLALGRREDSTFSLPGVTQSLNMAKISAEFLRLITDNQVVFRKFAVN